MAQGTCSVIENGTRCTKPSIKRTMCQMHYERLRLTGSTDERRPPAKRFWEKVDKNGPIPEGRPELGRCWVWKGSCQRTGYGRFLGFSRRVVGAHQFSWFLHFGSEPMGHVCHHCDNPPCVRPSHLFLGTRSDNATDMALKFRGWAQRKTHCPHGHPYDATNTIWKKGSAGELTRRQCRACRDIWGAEIRRRNNHPERPPSVEFVSMFGKSS